ncbi:hypothetical protein ACOKM5_40740 [Streptomyces sp. BH097]|uniref:hypothetical protein n=1 Tax=unclassified Streptomyces TaxID=2593676 RepID=UPI003BB7426D
MNRREKLRPAFVRARHAEPPKQLTGRAEIAATAVAAIVAFGLLGLITGTWGEWTWMIYTAMTFAVFRSMVQWVWLQSGRAVSLWSPLPAW